MAVCKRCNTVFNYEKREGVCPKCCFYNRPANSWHEDDSWIKNYNYEDNSYNSASYSVNDDNRSDRFFGKDVNDVGGRLKDRLGNHSSGEVNGSHKHLPNGQVVTGSRAVSKKGGRNGSQAGNQAGKKKNGGCVTFLVIIFWLYAIFTVFGFLMR